MSLSTFDAFKTLTGRKDMVELTDDELRQLQGVLLDIVADIDETCEQEGIEYCLCGGSVLGAVRHQDIIPWDDDIDLYMTRTAFERFERVFDEHMAKDYYLFTPYRESRFILSVPQVRKRGTYVRLRDDFYLADEECGACVDIFILDNAPDNPVIRKLHGVGSLALGLIASCRKFARHRDWFVALAGDDEQLAHTFKVKAAIGRLFAWRSENGWARTWDWWNGLCKNAESRLLVDATGRTHYFSSLRPREVFLPPVKLPFSKLSLPVPHDWKTYLTGHYGSDYMTPPSTEHREHHVVFGFKLT